MAGTPAPARSFNAPSKSSATSAGSHNETHPRLVPDRALRPARPQPPPKTVGPPQTQPRPLHLQDPHQRNHPATRTPAHTSRNSQPAASHVASYVVRPCRSRHDARRSCHHRLLPDVRHALHPRVDVVAPHTNAHARPVPPRLHRQGTRPLVLLHPAGVPVIAP